MHHLVHVDSPQCSPFGASSAQCLCLSLQAQENLTKAYQPRLYENDYYGYVANFESLSGLVDVTVIAQELNPDTQSITFTMAGVPYGPIAYYGNSNLLGLSFASTSEVLGPYATSPVHSCKMPFVNGKGCADLKIMFDKHAMSYATSQGLTRQVFSVDVDSVRGLDNYPFDTYTATGTVKVRLTQHAMHQI
jgi:hypothetical protein